MVLAQHFMMRSSKFYSVPVGDEVRDTPTSARFDLVWEEVRSTYLHSFEPEVYGVAFTLGDGILTTSFIPSGNGLSGLITARGLCVENVVIHGTHKKPLTID